jgi:hypothetical protein
MLDPYGNSYPKGVMDNPSVITDHRMLTQSLASSINEQMNIAIKLKSERSEIQREINAEENH